MKTNFKLFRKFFMLFALVAIVSCSKDEAPSITDPNDTDSDGIVDANDDCPNEAGPASNNGCPETIGTGLVEVVASGNAFESFPPSTTETDVAGSETTATEPYDRKESADGDTIEQRWICTSKEVDVTGGTHTFPLYNTNASVIWPGNLLQGKTLDNATPTDIVVKRAGGTITYNLVTGNPVATDSVNVIDQGTVQQAMNNIIAQNGDVTPANFTLDVVAVNSSEQLALEMGLKASNLTTKVSSNFSLNTSSSVSSVLVKLTQQYYTMSYVKPTSIDEVFDPSVTATQLETFIQPDNPATFISSVTYGRIFYMLYESTASAEDMKAALTGSYNAVAGKLSASVDIQSLREYNELRVKVIAYGGDSQGTLNSVGATFGGENEDAVDGIQDLVSRLAEASDIAGGLPLSYVVNSLENPSQVISTNLATKYTVKTCELRGVLPSLGYRPLFELFKNDDDEGGIGAMFQIRDGDILVFNKAGTRYAWYDGNEAIVDEKIKGVWDVTDPNGPIGGTTFTSIGACTRFANNKIYIFDASGLANEIFTYDFSTASPDGGPIGTYNSLNGENRIYSVNTIFGDSGGFPYANQGFTAGARFDLDGRKIFFGNDGSTYALYNSSNNGSWEPETNATAFGTGGGNDPGATLFEKVGAATFISFGGGSGRWLFINEAGDEMMEYETDLGSFNGPWIIN